VTPGRRVEISALARVDLDQIAMWSKTRWSDVTANESIESILVRLRQLEAFPEFGLLISPAYPRVFRLRAGSHTAIYHLGNNVKTVHRIMHDRSDDTNIDLDVLVNLNESDG
jgi:plasmid stabilization system protein ParE